MRTLIINLLATALLLLGASSASALGFQMELNPGSITPSTELVGSQFVIVDIYMDAGPGLGFITVSILWDDIGILEYNAANPGTNMPSYILYTPGAGTASATYMIPNVNPPNYWNGINQPGKRQVQIEYLEPAFGSATATANHLWIATVVFHVTGPGVVDMNLTLNANGTIVESYTNDVAGSYTTTGAFTFGHAVPEPTTALLIGFGLVGLTMAGRRKD
jgi:hypothetical protein